MNFPSEPQQNSLVIRSNVEKLDTHTAPELKSVCTFENKNGNNKIILDLSLTKFCDSSGLSAILVANRLCKDTNGKFAIVGVQPIVLKMIEIAQLDSVFSLYPTINEAISHFE